MPSLASLSKFHCGSHKLPVSFVQYLEASTPKLYTLCDTRDQGDKYHCILVCPALNEDRIKFIKPKYRTRPNALKLNWLFNVQSNKELSNLAKCVTLIMSKFN